MSKQNIPDKAFAPTGLRLVNAFRPANYLHIIDINLEFNPQTSTADRLFARAEEHHEYKERDLPRLTIERIRNLMEYALVKDYALFQEGSHIKLYLNNDEDFFIAVAGLQPEKSYTADYIEFSENTSARKLKKYTKKLQERFEDTVVAGKVKLDYDAERHMVRVHAGNGNDFVQFWSENRKIEAAILAMK